MPATHQRGAGFEAAEDAMLPHLDYAAAHTPPMPCRLLKLAEAHW
ncbi:MAG: hypothetical protein WCA32_13790 [Chromatiaceae bacterium]